MKVTTEGAAKPVLTGDVISQQRHNRFRKHLMTMSVSKKQKTPNLPMHPQYLRYLHTLTCSFPLPQTEDHLWPQKAAVLAGLYRCQHLSSSIYTAQKSNATQHTQHQAVRTTHQYTPHSYCSHKLSQITISTSFTGLQII